MLRSLAEYLDAPIAIIDYAQDDTGREEGYIIGEVEGKTAILVDDILNTGKTFAEAAKILERGGVNDIYAVASHGLFAGGAGEVLNASQSKKSWLQIQLQLKKMFLQVLNTFQQVSLSLMLLPVSLNVNHLAHFCIYRQRGIIYGLFG